MDHRRLLRALAATHALDAAAVHRLARASGALDEPARLEAGLTAGLAKVAGALVGFGLLLWVAANWAEWDRFMRMSVPAAVVGVAALAAIARPALRVAALAVMAAATGALFVVIGQAYPTGVDPWQFFALWAALVLPMALAARSDLLWTPWSVLMVVTATTWSVAHTGQRWSPRAEDLPVHLVAFVIALAPWAVTLPAAARYTGAGHWAHRSAALLAVLCVMFTAVGGLLGERVAPHFWLGLVMIAGVAAAMRQRRFFDIFVLSAAALGLNVLLVGGFVRLLVEGSVGSAIGLLFPVGLVAAGALAGTVQYVMREQRRLDPAPVPALPASGVTPPPADAAFAPTLPPAAAPAPAPAPAPAAAAPVPLPAWFREARVRGLLPADAAWPDAPPARPWPVVLMTALGAWLAALPLLGVVAMVLGPALQGVAGTLVAGLALVSGAVVVLRSRGVGLFVEQLAWPMLLVGLGSLGMSLTRQGMGWGPSAVSASMGLVCLGVAFLLPVRWQRVLLGAGAALCLGWWLSALIEPLFPRGGPGWGRGHLAGWWAMVLLTLGWAGLQAWLDGPGRGARTATLAEAVDAVADGLVLVLLAGAAAWSGMAYLAGGTLGSGAGGDVARLGAGLVTRGAPVDGLVAAAGLALAAGAAAWLVRAWPGLRRPAMAPVGLALLAGAFASPALGVAAVVLAVALRARRRGLAGAAALAAVWVVGAMYHAMDGSLSAKAAGLVLAGVVAAATAAWLHRTRDREDPAWAATQLSAGPSTLPVTAGPESVSPSGFAPTVVATAPLPVRSTLPWPPTQGGSVPAGDAAEAFIAAPPVATAAPGWWTLRGGAGVALTALAGVATLGLAGLTVHGHETVLREGRPLFLRLAPVDPRSLTHGDYMRLGWMLPPGLPALDRPPHAGLGAQPAWVAARPDADGVGALRLAAGPRDRQDGEQLIRLSVKAGRWVVTTDAWFFAEGEEKTFAPARFGEFRVHADGRALLVGLADEQRRPLGRRP
jgi:hypothetical protein